MLTTAGRTLSTMSAKPVMGAAGSWAAVAALSWVPDCAVSEPASANPAPPIIKAAKAVAVTTVLGLPAIHVFFSMPFNSRCCISPKLGSKTGVQDWDAVGLDTVHTTPTRLRRPQSFT
jgi:hypothetical protein